MDYPTIVRWSVLFGVSGAALLIEIGPVMVGLCPFFCFCLIIN